MLFGIRGKVLLSTKSNELKKNSLSIYVTNPKYSTPLRIIVRFAIILDYHPFNIIGKLIFLHKCGHSHLDSSYLVGNIQYHCPSRSLRNYTPFRISNSRINIRKCSVLNRCMTTFNTLYLTEPNCDIFIGANNFRSVIQKHFYV